MNENTVAQPKKSGTFLKVVLIIITLISVVAAAAMGLLYYNAITNLELVREKNVALGEDRDKYKEQAAEYEVQIAGYEQEIEDLTKQLAESQAILETPTLAGQETDVDGSTDTNVTEDAKEEAEANAGKVTVSDLANVKTLDVKPDKLFDEGVVYTVTVKGANMRSGPSTNHRTVLSVYQNDVVTAYAEDGDWLLVKNEYGGYGWIKNTLVAKK
ncbi:MAG: SH3 domain-containing protein [Oscillospiraceae bacterium]|nr:SH3 domain-containing protein [Oscillospiraceae bacterium]